MPIELGFLDRQRDDAEVVVVGDVGLDRVGVETEQVDAGVGGGVIVARGQVSAGVFLDHERLGAGIVGVDPVGLRLEVGGGRGARARLVGEIETVDLGTADERLDRCLKRGGRSPGHAEIDERLGSGRQFAELRGRTDISQIETVGRRRISRPDEISIRRIV